MPVYGREYDSKCSNATCKQFREKQQNESIIDLFIATILSQLELSLLDCLTVFIGPYSNNCLKM